MAANMWKNSLKNVESENNKILYENLLDFILQRNGTYCLNKPRNLYQRLEGGDVEMQMTHKRTALTGQHKLR